MKKLIFIFGGIDTLDQSIEQMVLAAQARGIEYMEAHPEDGVQEMVDQMEMGYIPFDQQEYDAMRDDIVSVYDIEGMASYDVVDLELDDVHSKTVERAMAWYFAAVQNAERRAS